MVTTDIVTDVEVETAEEEKMEKNNGAASETPSLSSPLSSPYLPLTRDVVTNEEKMERDDDNASKTPSFSSSLLSPPPFTAAMDVIIKEEAETTEGRGIEEG